MSNFEMFKSKLHILKEWEPEIQFGHIELENKEDNVKGEMFVFHCSYLVSEDDLDGYSKENVDNLDVDYEIDNFMRVYTYSYLCAKKIQKEGGYVFVINRSRLLERDDGEGYIRYSIGASVHESLNIPKDELMALGMEFVDEMPMTYLDVHRVADLYNRSVESVDILTKQNENTEKTYCYYLPKLSMLCRLPFGGKGAVYHFKGGYLYETNTMLFDYLETYDGNFSREHIAIEDVGKLYDCFDKEVQK